MSDILYDSYLRMLKGLREDGKEFSKKYPDIASMLDINSQRSMDPETERIIESFAYMASQVDIKIEDNYFKFLENFATNLFPEVITPIPAYTILQMSQTEQQKEKNGLSGTFMKQGTHFEVFAKNKSFIFQTTRDLNIQNVWVQNAEIKDVKLSEKESGYEKIKGIHLSLNLGRSFFENMDKRPANVTLRLYINSELTNALRIYDAIFANKQNFFLFDGEDNYLDIVPKDNIKPVFDSFNYFADFHMKNSVFQLFEFCTFINKYLFIDITIPLRTIVNSHVNVVIPLRDHYITHMDKETFLDNCVPVYNVFERDLEPILFKEEVFDYDINSDYMKTNDVDVIELSSVSCKFFNDDDVKIVKKYESYTNYSQKITANNYTWATRYLSSLKETVIKFYITPVGETEAQINYIFPKGICRSNYKDVNFMSHEEFRCLEDLPVSVGTSLFSPVIMTHSYQTETSRANFIKGLFDFNQRISLNDFEEISFIFSVMKQFARSSESVYVTISEIFNSIMHIEKTYFNDINAIGKRVFHVSGANYQLHVSSAGGSSHGIHLIKNFLNHYLDSVRSFNFKIVTSIHYK